MVSHLGPGNGTGRPDRLDERSKTKAGESLISHIVPWSAGALLNKMNERVMPSVQTAKRLAGPLRVATDNINQYNAKVFRIKRVTSDGEPAIKATMDLEAIGVELNE